jgi:hypothetical protein
VHLLNSIRSKPALIIAILLRRAGRALVAGRFWRDFFLSLVITLALLGIAYMTVGQTPLLAAAFIMPLIIFGFLIGPIVMFVIGVLRGRPGFAAAPALLLVALLAYRHANLVEAAHEAQTAVDKAASFNVYPFLAPVKPHDIVAIQDSYDAREGGACSPICRQILLTSDYAVGVAETASGQWRVHRKAAGHEFCSQPAQVESYVSLLNYRHAGVCITLAHEAPHKDALVIRENRSEHASANNLLPKSVQGLVMEFFERTDGQDRLLGRVISGTVQPPLLSGQQATQTPINMTDADFYAAALNLPIQQQEPLGSDPIETLALVLEDLFDDPMAGKDARAAFGMLGYKAKSEAEIQPFRAHVVRLLQSSDAQRIVVGLRSLKGLSKFGLDFAKPAVVRYLADSNPEVMKTAVHAMFAYTEVHNRRRTDLDFAKPALAELILSDRVEAYRDDYGSVMRILESVSGPFPPQLRDLPKSLLAARSDLTDERLAIVLAVVARGSDENRQEAADWVLALPSNRFEDAVLAVRPARTLVDGLDFWSERDMETLADRAAEVPSDRLAAFIDAFRFQVAFASVRPAIVALLKKRVAQLQAGPAADQRLAKKLARYSDRL